MSQDANPVVLYMHIPKAAGTTVSGVLFHCLRSTNSSYEEYGHLISGVYYYPSGFVAPLSKTGSEEAQRVLSRRDLTAVLGHFYYGVHTMLPMPANYITILRSPLERFISLFYFHKLVQQRWGALEGSRLPDDISLEAFARTVFYKELDNGQTRRISGYDPEIGKCTAAMLDRAKQNLHQHFAVVGTTERLEETLVLMKRRFGWRDDLAYYPKNTNPSRPCADSLPPSVRAMILAHNALDVELYEFAAGLLDDKIRASGAPFFEDLKKLKERNSRIAGC